MSDPIELEALEALAKAATPGPWERGDLVRAPFAGLEDQHNVYPPLGESGPVAEVAGPDNAAYIAAMNPQTALSILAAVRERDAEIERLRACNTNLRQTLDDRGAALERAEAGEVEALSDARKAEQSYAALHSTFEEERALLHEETALLAPVQEAARTGEHVGVPVKAAGLFVGVVTAALATIADEKPAPVDSEAARQEMLKAGR